MSSTPIPITSYTIGTIETPASSLPGSLAPNPIGDGHDSACNRTQSTSNSSNSSSMTQSNNQNSNSLSNSVASELSGLSRFLKTHLLFTVLLIVVLTTLIFRRETK